jgi:hypothetical protein
MTPQRGKSLHGIKPNLGDAIFKVRKPLKAIVLKNLLPAVTDWRCAQRWMQKKTRRGRRVYLAASAVFQ